MRKLLAIILAALMLLGTAAALAEEAETEYSRDYAGTTLTMAGWHPEYPEFWALF